MEEREDGRTLREVWLDVRTWSKRKIERRLGEAIWVYDLLGKQKQGWIRAARDRNQMRVDIEIAIRRSTWHEGKNGKRGHDHETAYRSDRWRERDLTRRLASGVKIEDEDLTDIEDQFTWSVAVRG